jgi:hypothetical protein
MLDFTDSSIVVKKSPPASQMAGLSISLRIDGIVVKLLPRRRFDSYAQLNQAFYP